MADLTPELESERKRILKAAKELGLDFYETIFEVVTYKELNMVASRGGFPTRYPHWRFGMEYEHLSKSYEYGLSKIYELVINNDPCYAYLMEGNEFLDQKLVMAHVYGHCDFFKNNQWFSQTDRKMIDTTANHATRVRRYIDRYGIEVVESFIDCCLSIENLIDRHSPYFQKEAPNYKAPAVSNSEPVITEPGRLKVHRSYMEKFINPPEELKQASAKAQEDREQNKEMFPPQPEKDVLHFLINFAPLEDWQSDILGIIRHEAYYFAPQGMTKIMNEGWASYWHSKILTEHIINDSEIIDFADRHSGTMAMAPGGFNPYKVGIELFRHIEERWDKGQFGLEWLECEDGEIKKRWDTKAKIGRQKIFEVRRNYNDVTFIDEFLSEDFCVQNKLFVYKFNKRTGKFEVDTRDFPAIKKKFLFQLTNFGQPSISVVDANFENRGELLLGHIFEGIELQPDYMSETLKNMFVFWKRPVNLATILDGEPRIVKYDGKEFKNILVSDLPKGDQNSSPTDPEAKTSN
jgi:stage V sporulation protein R